MLKRIGASPITMTPSNVPHGENNQFIE